LELGLKRARPQFDLGGFVGRRGAYEPVIELLGLGPHLLATVARKP